MRNYFPNPMILYDLYFKMIIFDTYNELHKTIKRSCFVLTHTRYLFLKEKKIGWYLSLFKYYSDIEC